MMNSILKPSSGFRNWYVWAVFSKKISGCFSIVSVLNLLETRKCLVSPTNAVVETNFDNKSSSTGKYLQSVHAYSGSKRRKLTSPGSQSHIPPCHQGHQNQPRQSILFITAPAEYAYLLMQQSEISRQNRFKISLPSEEGVIVVKNYIDFGEQPIGRSFDQSFCWSLID
jgi:hypothetical protein